MDDFTYKFLVIGAILIPLMAGGMFLTSWLIGRKRDKQKTST